MTDGSPERPVIEVDPALCARDGLCVGVCPARILSLPDEGPPRAIEGASELCIDCGHCVAVCPHAALRQRSMGPEDCPALPEGYRPTPEEAERFLRARRSIRWYKDAAVPQEQLEDLIRVASHAPTGHNLQGVRWLVLSGREQLRPLAGLVIDWMRGVQVAAPRMAALLHLERPIADWEAGRDRILRDAPHLILTFGLKDDRTAPPACTLALAYLELAAPAFGLGACWAGYFGAAARAHAPLREAIGLPEVQEIHGAMMVGLPRARYRRLPLRRPPRIQFR